MKIKPGRKARKPRALPSLPTTLFAVRLPSGLLASGHDGAYVWGAWNEADAWAAHCAGRVVTYGLLSGE